MSDKDKETSPSKDEGKEKDKNEGSPKDDNQELQDLKKENESLKKSVQDLTSQRDKNFDKAKATSEEVEAYVAKAKLEEGVDKFLEENKKDFPNVTKKDLMRATNVEAIKATAERVQTTYEDVEQRALEGIQKVGTPPQISDEDAERELKDLKEKAPTDPKAFEKYLEIQQRRTGSTL